MFWEFALQYHHIILSTVSCEDLDAHAAIVFWNSWSSHHPSRVRSLQLELSYRTIIFDLVTLTLKFDLLFKNFNLGYILTIRDMAFIFHICIPCDQTFQYGP